jgi:hypothetical protein
VGTTAAYQYLDQATLGSLGRYTLSDTTRYALMVSTIGSGVQWVLPAAGNSVTPSGVSFYTVLSGVTSTTGGTMNGGQLAEAARALPPALPILPRIGCAGTSLGRAPPCHAGAVAAKPRQVRPIDEDGAPSVLNQGFV